MQKKAETEAVSVTEKAAQKIIAAEKKAAKAAQAAQDVKAKQIEEAKKEKPFEAKLVEGAEVKGPGKYKPKTHRIAQILPPEKIQKETSQLAQTFQGALEKYQLEVEANFTASDILFAILSESVEGYKELDARYQVLKAHWAVCGNIKNLLAVLSNASDADSVGQAYQIWSKENGEKFYSILAEQKTIRREMELLHQKESEYAKNEIDKYLDDTQYADELNQFLSQPIGDTKSLFYPEVTKDAGPIIASPRRSSLLDELEQKWEKWGERRKQIQGTQIKLDPFFNEFQTASLNWRNIKRQYGIVENEDKSQELKKLIEQVQDSLKELPEKDFEPVINGLITVIKDSTQEINRRITFTKQAYQESEKEWKQVIHRTQKEIKKAAKVFENLALDLYILELDPDNKGFYQRHKNWKESYQQYKACQATYQSLQQDYERATTEFNMIGSIYSIRERAIQKMEHAAVESRSNVDKLRTTQFKVFLAEVHKELHGMVEFEIRSLNSFEKSLESDVRNLYSTLKTLPESNNKNACWAELKELESGIKAILERNPEDFNLKGLRAKKDDLSIKQKKIENLQKKIWDLNSEAEKQWQVFRKSISFISKIISVENPDEDISISYIQEKLKTFYHDRVSEFKQMHLKDRPLSKADIEKFHTEYNLALATSQESLLVSLNAKLNEINAKATEIGEKPDPILEQAKIKIEETSKLEGAKKNEYSMTMIILNCIDLSKRFDRELELYKNIKRQQEEESKRQAEILRQQKELREKQLEESKQQKRELIKQNRAASTEVFLIQQNIELITTAIETANQNGSEMSAESTDWLQKLKIALEEQITIYIQDLKLLRKDFLKNVIDTFENSIQNIPQEVPVEEKSARLKLIIECLNFILERVYDVFTTIVSVIGIYGLYSSTTDTKKETPETKLSEKEEFVLQLKCVKTNLTAMLSEVENNPDPSCYRGL